MFNQFSVDGNKYNRFVNLDNIEYRIVQFLAKSDNKYADYLFKILKWDTMDALMRPSLTYEERMKLLYSNNGDAAGERIFLSPFIDDSFEEQSSHLHIYIHSLVPQSHLTSVVNIGLETIVHNKISNIQGDAAMYNPDTNPSEMGNDGQPEIILKNRASAMLKCVLAALNGSFKCGVGTLQFNNTLSSADNSKMSLWNGKKFFGFSTVMSMLISGVSDTPECGN